MLNSAIPRETLRGWIPETIKKLFLEDYRISEHLEICLFHATRKPSSIEGGEKKRKTM